MKANIATLVVLLCAIAAAMSISRSQVSEPAPKRVAQLRITHLNLLLSTKPIPVTPEGEVIFAEGSTLSIWIDAVDGGGADGRTSFHRDGVMEDEHGFQLSGPEWTALSEELSPLKGWRTKLCDDCAPEAEVLYTLLKLETSEGNFTSSWRGLPEEQRLVADKLLSSPLGDDLRKGMERLSSAKLKSRMERVPSAKAK